MGLFGFGGKKEETKREKTKQTFPEIDYRWDKYYLKDIFLPELGKVVYITKNIVYIKTEKENKELQAGMYAHIEIAGKKYKSMIIDASETYLTLALPEDFQNIDFIKKYINYLQTYKAQKKINISEDDIKNTKVSSDLISLFNLLTELEDPNTDAQQLKMLFDLLPPLKNKVIELANSMAERALEEIKDVETAILRLGLDRLRKIVGEYFELFVANYKPDFENFENISQMNLAKVECFKETAPLISFQIRRKAGIVLLLIDLVSSAASIFYQKDEKYRHTLKNSVYFYSYPMRQYEKSTFGEDFLSLNFKFISQKIKPLAEVYDSYKLGHLMFYPMYSVERESINMSNRNLKRAYIYYIVFLMVNYLVYGDKKSGYILYNRLRRFGMSLNEAIEFLNQVVFTVNKSLSNIGVKPYLRSPSAVSYNIDTTKIFPETTDFKTVYDRFKAVGQGKENRLVIRSQDINFSALLVWYLLNDNSIGLSSKTFAVLPVRSIQNPDSLLVENLSSFDIIYFKGLDELDPAMYREFYKLWKTFEGIIIADYSYYSFLDFDQQKIQLFHVIKDKKIDAPLLTENRKAYEFAVRYVQDGYTWLTGKTDYHNLEEIFLKTYDLDSIWSLVYG